jgi:hypothetical protein
MSFLISWRTLVRQERLFRKWDELNLLPQEQKLSRERTEFFPIANDARVILRRIRLRFNPLSNLYKAQDDRFVQKICALLAIVAAT